MRITAFLIVFLLLISGCEQEKQRDQQRKTLIIFCGITMANPVRELAKRFEEQHKVTVMITYGGSQDLAKSIEINRIGDIYFPGFKSFVDRMAGQGHIQNSTHVGQNELVLLVAKGNPKQLTSDIKQLKDPALAVVIGHEDLGSVGKESRRLLMEQGIYEQVVNNTVFMASDSKGLTAAIRDKKADIVLNWKATVKHQHNADYIDVISLDGILPRPLVMATLVYSANPDLAQAFLDLCTSEEGQAVFQQYGF